MQKERDHGIDNLKLLGVFLVVLGHSIMSFGAPGWRAGFIGSVYACIYSFHMPLFIFISGFLSKRDPDPRKLVTSLLLPFVIFNLIYCLLFYRPGLLNFFTPRKALWYLLSMFFWRLTVKPFARLRLCLAVSIAISLYVGLADVGSFLAASRTVVFFPFFLAGYLLPEKGLEKLRSANKALLLGGVAAGLTATVLFRRLDLFGLRLYYAKASYKELGLGDFEGILYRAAIMAAAFLIVVCLVGLMPKKRFFLTFIGENSLTVYLFHLYVIKACEEIVRASGVKIGSGNAVNFALILVFAALTALICGNRPLAKGYSYAMEKISSLIVK